MKTYLNGVLLVRSSLYLAVNNEVYKKVDTNHSILQRLLYSSEVSPRYPAFSNKALLDDIHAEHVQGVVDGLLLPDSYHPGADVSSYVCEDQATVILCLFQYLKV